MPGVLPHLLAGTAMFIIGSFYFKNYFKGTDKTKKLLLLATVCLLFSIIVDFFLIIYYTTQVLSFCEILKYHEFLQILAVPIAIFALIILKFGFNLKNKPLWIMGMWCILLHIAMDLLIPDSGMSIWI